MLLAYQDNSGSWVLDSDCKHQLMLPSQLWGAVCGAEGRESEENITISHEWKLKGCSQACLVNCLKGNWLQERSWHTDGSPRQGNGPVP